MDVTVRESTFTKNTAGGISFQIDQFGTGSLTVDRSAFVNNRTLQGGGIFAAGFGSGVTIAVTNCFLTHNRTTKTKFPFAPLHGGGIAIAGSGTTTAMLVNDTIVDNRAATGGGLFVDSGPTVDLTNVILWDNRPTISS